MVFSIVEARAYTTHRSVRSPDSEGGASGHCPGCLGQWAEPGDLLPSDKKP